MPILPRIGRRHLSLRILVAAMYGLLVAGAITMLYPFALMVAGSTKSGVDVSELRLVPAFLTDRDALYRKYVEALFNESLLLAQQTYDLDLASFAELPIPPDAPRGLLDAWDDFLASEAAPPTTWTVGFFGAPVSRGTVPLNLRALKRELAAEGGGSLDRVNETYRTIFTSWNVVTWRMRDWLLRTTSLVPTPYDTRALAYAVAQPRAHRFAANVEGFYRRVFLRNRYSRDLESLNRAYGTTHADWGAIPVPLRAPPIHSPVARADWEVFVREILNLQWIAADAHVVAPYREYLRARYGRVEIVAARYQQDLTAWEDVRIPSARAGLALSDWESFVKGWRDPDTGEWHVAPLDGLRLDTLAARFREALRVRFDSLDAANAGLGTSFASWDEIVPPQREYHAAAFAGEESFWRREFATRNLVAVLDFVALRGRALANTAIYCLLAVLSALIVNPLAAYALSRYKPPSRYKILLFLMLTMAFPPMVTQIPVFLMLREIELLNTFWALVLPGLASGYSIFLLKGFFDSLPQELYESAEMDGAGEFRIFWQITMSLSQPILAVVALNAFTHAYSSFMYALLICQDPAMWTLMPWLYQLQQVSAPGVVYASLLVAAAPMLVMFVLCQNVIMRGIVIPVEK